MRKGTAVVSRVNKLLKKSYDELITLDDPILKDNSFWKKKYESEYNPPEGDVENWKIFYRSIMLSNMDIFHELLNFTYRELFIEELKPNNNLIIEVLNNDYFWELKYDRDFPEVPPPQAANWKDAYKTTFENIVIERSLYNILEKLRYDVTAINGKIYEKYIRYMSNDVRKPHECAMGGGMSMIVKDVSALPQDWILNIDNTDKEKKRAEAIEGIFRHYYHLTADANSEDEYYGTIFINLVLIDDRYYFKLAKDKKNIEYTYGNEPSEVNEYLFELMESGVNDIRIYFFMSPTGEEIFRCVVTTDNTKKGFTDISWNVLKLYLSDILRANIVYPIITTTSYKNGDHGTLCGPWIVNKYNE